MDKIPTWLRTGSQKRPTKNPIKIINNPELFNEKLLGKKFSNAF